MAWWLCRNYTYAGPGFDWIDQDKVEIPRGLGGSGLSISRSVTEKSVPKSARYRAPYAKPPKPDIFFVDSDVAVTARFRELAEKFEPSVHLFAPIELQYYDGDPIEAEFFYFNANVDIDCILTENEPEWFRATRFDGSIRPTLTSIQRLTPREIYLSRPQIAGHHMWTGGPLGWNQLFVSNEFCAALRKGRFGALEFRRECHEVDRPWIAEENMGPLLGAWQNFVDHDRNVEVGYI